MSSLTLVEQIGMPALSIQEFPARNYDLGATLSSGQAFRWRLTDRGWVGIIGRRWLRLKENTGSITCEAVAPVTDWTWLRDYLQLDLDLPGVLSTFPDDPPMRAAVAACSGLRLLRQEPWECLASFILSSTKRILQIQQVVARVCECYGDPIAVPEGEAPSWSFPSPARLAGASERELRECRMGFRAPYLREAARRVASGEIDLAAIRRGSVELGRAKLIELPGVGRKIADCVLLFAYGFEAAFPVDVWVLKALRQLYFPRRRVPLKKLRRFADEHFGPHAGYAQQYLFHYMRVAGKGELQKT